ncbi:MAG: MmgE/PrpD family protein [Deltaproteobacteria bacterium]|nr:MmgE/PrpD family protein [Deltaproteobacteria bacterium]
MEPERELARYAVEAAYSELPPESVHIVKNVILTVMGTTIAGATADGCEALVNQVREWGGKKEATLLLYGGRVPAHNAALANSAMARALDFCDAMSPGIHIGSSAVPTALATAELTGGCSGRDFLASILVSTEIAARINAVSDYDGFDPTGVCSIFASTVVAGRILRLNPQQMLHALALAFNKAGGSLQSNIDGALAVRVIQGFVSQGGLICAQLARRGITGPRNFLDGIYGYFHLYAKGRRDLEAIVGDLGKRFEMNNTIFKKHPSCGCTLASTDAALDLMKEKNLSADHVAHVDIRVSPYAYKLAGHPFEIGDNPKVNAQFSIQYCVGNALLRGSSKLAHFDEASITDKKVQELVKKIHVSVDPAMALSLGQEASTSTHLAVRMDLTTTDGTVHHRAVDTPRGNPKRPLSDGEHMERFRDCVRYADRPVPEANTERLLKAIAHIEHVQDVRSLIPLLLPTEGENQDSEVS